MTAPALSVVSVALAASKSINAIDLSGTGIGPFVLLHGLADGAGAQLGVKGNPLLVAEAPFSSAVALAAGGAAVAAGRAVGVYGTAIGEVILTLAGGGTVTVPVELGWQVFAFAATGFAFGAAGAGTVSNLS